MGSLHTAPAGAGNKHRPQPEALRPAALLHRPLLAKCNIVPAGKGGHLRRFSSSITFWPNGKAALSQSATRAWLLYTHTTHTYQNNTGKNCSGKNYQNKDSFLLAQSVLDAHSACLHSLRKATWPTLAAGRTPRPGFSDPLSSLSFPTGTALCTE